VNQRLALAIQTFTKNISSNPSMYPLVKGDNIRKAVLLKYNTLIYQFDGEK
jgi:hypothetical protein